MRILRDQLHWRIFELPSVSSIIIIYFYYYELLASRSVCLQIKYLAVHISLESPYYSICNVLQRINPLDHSQSARDDQVRQLRAVFKGMGVTG